MNISPDELRAIKALLECSETLGFRMILVGASARRVLFELEHRHPMGRATTDWDWGVWIRDWGAFEDMKRALLKSGFSKSKIEHQLTFRDSVRFDFIPFGPISGTSGTLDWPGSGMKMDVVGFEESLESMSIVDIQGMRVPTVSVAGLCLLKTLSYGSGDPGRKKDLLDLCYVLKNCSEIVPDRIIDNHELLLERGLDFESAGAFLVGKDILGFARDETAAAAKSIVSEVMKDADTHLLAISTQSFDEEQQLKEVRFRINLLRSFHDGLSHQ